MVQTIEVQRLVRVSLMLRTIVRVSRTAQTIVAQRLVLASRTPRRVAPDSRTTTGTFLVRAAPATVTPVDARMTMLLGPALLIIVRLLRKHAMLRWTTVVRVSWFRVRSRAIGLIRPPSSNPGSIRARVPRTIVRKNHPKPGPRIIVLRKLRK